MLMHTHCKVFTGARMDLRETGYLITLNIILYKACYFIFITVTYCKINNADRNISVIDQTTVIDALFYLHWLHYEWLSYDSCLSPHLRLE